MKPWSATPRTSVPLPLAREITSSCVALSTWSARCRSKSRCALKSKGASGSSKNAMQLPSDKKCAVPARPVRFWSHRSPAYSPVADQGNTRIKHTSLQNPGIDTPRHLVVQSWTHPDQSHHVVDRSANQIVPLSRPARHQSGVSSDKSSAPL